MACTQVTQTGLHILSSSYNIVYHSLAATTLYSRCHYSQHISLYWQAYYRQLQMRIRASYTIDRGHEGVLYVFSYHIYLDPHCIL